MATLGQVVRQLREEKGISLSKLERMADLSNPTVVALERDEANPTMKTIGKVATVFGMTAVELIGMVDEEGGE